MYNDYLNDEFDDAIDEYNSFMDDYDSDITDLKMQEWQAKDECQRQLREIDEYWDRENKYIKTSGIYTPRPTPEGGKKRKPGVSICGILPLKEAKRENQR